MSSLRSHLFLLLLPASAAWSHSSSVFSINFVTFSFQLNDFWRKLPAIFFTREFILVLLSPPSVPSLPPVLLPAFLSATESVEYIR